MKDEYGKIIELIIPMYEDKIHTIDLEASSGEVIRCKDCIMRRVCIVAKCHNGIDKNPFDPEWYCGNGRIDS